MPRLLSFNLNWTLPSLQIEVTVQAFWPLSMSTDDNKQWERPWGTFPMFKLSHSMEFGNLGCHTGMCWWLFQLFNLAHACSHLACHFLNLAVIYPVFFPCTLIVYCDVCFEILWTEPPLVIHEICDTDCCFVVPLSRAIFNAWTKIWRECVCS